MRAALWVALAMSPAVAAAPALAATGSVETGSISGRVTASEGRPLAGLAVEVDTYPVPKTAIVAADGSYRVGGLVRGSYQVRVHGGGWAGEAWPGTPCPFVHCGAATWVQVRPPGNVPGVDFELDLGGSLAGRITDGDGKAVAGATVALYADSSSDSGVWRANANGRFEIDGLAAGRRYLLEVRAPGYLSQWWRGVDCSVTSCSPGTQIPLEVTPGRRLDRLDVVLHRPGGLQGTIRDAASGAVVEARYVELYQGSWPLASTYPVHGRYAFSSLAPGPYTVKVYVYGWITSLYGDVPCPFDVCDARTGRQAEVVAGEVAVADINLPIAATMAGRVVATGSDVGVPADIWFYPADGPGYLLCHTDGEGKFTFSGLPAGSVRVVVTADDAHFVPTIQPDLDCLGDPCSRTSGSTFEVVAGSTTTVTLNANRGAIVSGRVRVPGAQPYGMWVVAGNAAHDPLDFAPAAYVRWDGSWRIPRLPPGDWHFYVYDGRWITTPVVELAYPDQPCPFQACNEPAAVHVEAGADLAGIDFSPPRGATIRGRVIDVSGRPVPGFVEAIDAGGRVYDWTGTRADGTYELTRLPAGTYFLGARSDTGAYVFGSHVAGLHPHAICPQLACDPSLAGAQAVTVGSGHRRRGVDIVLERGVQLSGRFASERYPWGYRERVRVFDRAGQTYSLTNVREEGWRSAPVPPGTYYVATEHPNLDVDRLDFGEVEAWQLDLVPQAYPGVLCHARTCDLSLATPVVVPAADNAPPEGLGGFDFLVRPGAAVRGTVRDRVSGRPLRNVGVALMVAGKDVPAATARTDEGGRFRIRGVAPGRYSVVTLTYPGYVAQAWPGVECPGGACAAEDRQWIEVGTSGEVDGIDLALGPEAAAIRGRITGATGTPIAGARVRAWGADGQAEELAVATDQTGEYVLHGLPAGEHRIVTEPIADRVRLLRTNVPCPGADCRRDGGEPLALVAGDEPVAVDFAPTRGPQILGQVTDAVTGAPLAGVEVELFDATEAFVTSVRTGWDGRYATSGVVPGTTVFVRTARTFDHRDQAWSGVDCEAGCDVAVATPIAVGPTDVEVDFTLAPIAP